jgi:hypothetical protein
MEAGVVIELDAADGGDAGEGVGLAGVNSR